MTDRFSLPPACLVRSLADMRDVLACGRAATLLSAPAAASFLGPAVWRATVRAALEGRAGDAVPDILDCADASGRALEALRLGQRLLVLRPDAPGAADVAERARVSGAQVLWAAPTALDLRRPRAHARLEAWLACADGADRTIPDEAGMPAMSTRDGKRRR